MYLTKEAGSIRTNIFHDKRRLVDVLPMTEENKLPLKRKRLTSFKKKTLIIWRIKSKIKGNGTVEEYYGNINAAP